MKAISEHWQSVSDSDTCDLDGFLTIMEQMGYRSEDMPNVDLMQDAWELLDGESCGRVLKRSVEYFLLIVEGFY